MHQLLGLGLASVCFCVHGTDTRRNWGSPKGPLFTNWGGETSAAVKFLPQTLSGLGLGLNSLQKHPETDRQLALREQENTES